MSIMTASVTSIMAVLLTSLSGLKIVGCAILASNVAVLEPAVRVGTSRKLKPEQHLRLLRRTRTLQVGCLGTYGSITEALEHW
jgi:hypothetical protein